RRARGAAVPAAVWRPAGSCGGAPPARHSASVLTTLFDKQSLLRSFSVSDLRKARFVTGEGVLDDGLLDRPHLVEPANRPVVRGLANDLALPARLAHLPLHPAPAPYLPL